jgi:glutaredoxin
MEYSAIFKNFKTVFCLYGFQRNYRQEEKEKIIVYTTSMTVVRQTADKCKAVRNMLQTHMVRYEERDMFMSAENQKELKERLGSSAICVPQVFVDGVHIGVSFKLILLICSTGVCLMTVFIHS